MQYFECYSDNINIIKDFVEFERNKGESYHCKLTEKAFYDEFKFWNPKSLTRQFDKIDGDFYSSGKKVGQFDEFMYILELVLNFDEPRVIETSIEKSELENYIKAYRVIPKEINNIDAEYDTDLLFIKIFDLKPTKI